MATIDVIQTGSVLVSAAVPNRDAKDNPLAFTGLFQSRKKRIELPVKCFLVEASGHRTLIDAGWSAQDAHDARRHLGFGLWFASEPVMETEEAVPARLSQMGLTVTDLDAVVFTHLDCDHISGSDGIKDASRILVSREELLAAKSRNPRYRPSLWESIEFECLDMKVDPAAPFNCSADIYGDGTLVAYLVPGHTAGSVVVIARDKETNAFAIIAGDTGYNADSWKDLQLPGPLYNKENMYRSLAFVRERMLADNCIGAFAAHDPAIAPGKYTF